MCACLPCRAGLERRDAAGLSGAALRGAPGAGADEQLHVGTHAPPAIRCRLCPSARLRPLHPTGPAWLPPRAPQLPAPCFNVFERDRSGARTHFCATCLLPHLGLQLSPDAVYTSPGGLPRGLCVAAQGVGSAWGAAAYRRGASLASAAPPAGALLPTPFLHCLPLQWMRWRMPPSWRLSTWRGRWRPTAPSSALPTPATWRRRVVFTGPLRAGGGRRAGVQRCSAGGMRWGLPRATRRRRRGAAAPRAQLCLSDSRPKRPPAAAGAPRLCDGA